MAIENITRITQQRATKADVEAFDGALEEGALSFASDTNELGIYTNGAWVWIKTGALAGHDHTATAGDGGVLTNDQHDGYSDYAEIAAPATPAANKVRLYAKDKSGVSTLYYKKDDGTEVELGAAGVGSGDVVGPASAVDGHLAVFDTTTGKLIKDGGAVPGGAGADGWVSAAESWTYVSADGATGVVTVPSGAASRYSVGMRVKLTQTTVKFFGVNAVTDTTLTLWGGTDYTLANAAISNNYYSPHKAPLGFPLSPLKWSIETHDTTGGNQASPTQNQWYNLGTVSIVLHIGAWNVYYKTWAAIEKNSAPSVSIATTLSTANNTEADTDFTSTILVGGGVETMAVYATLTAEKTLLMAAKATYYLNYKAGQTGVGTIYNLGNATPTIVRAVWAYL